MGQLREPAHVTDNEAEAGGLNGNRSSSGNRKESVAEAEAEAKEQEQKQKQQKEQKTKAKKPGGSRNGKTSTDGSSTTDGTKTREKSRAVPQKPRDAPKPSRDAPIEINEGMPESSSQNESFAKDMPFRKGDVPVGNRKFRASNRGWHAYALRFKAWANQEPAILRVREVLSQMEQKIDPILRKGYSVVRRMRDKLEPFTLRTWPVVKAWLILFARVLLMLALVSIECGSRGIVSIVRLGLAAIFLVVWCSALNLLILSGFLSFCIALGLSIAGAFLLGYTIALAVLALYGAAVLWLYGGFWTTVAVGAIGGGVFLAQQTKVAFYIIMLYAVYSTICNGGWMGLMLCTSLACVSNDIASHFMSNYDKNKRGGHDRNSHIHGKTSSARSRSHDHKTKSAFAQSSGQEAASDGNIKASTSGVSESDTVTPEEEVARLLACKDHYTALGLAPFDDIDVTILKREYRKKAMLVHPDKNRGNDEAEEAFKRLQNAYEILLDDAKRKSYDDDLRREELLRSLRQHFSNHQNTRSQSPDTGRQYSEEEGGSDIPLDAKRINCRTCNNSHIWFPTNKSKQQARWCQDCQDYHQAKNGDGWVEQSGHSFLFGIFQRVDLPRAYACSDNRVYDVTDWVLCQGMKCAPNTHKPSFSVSTASFGKASARAGAKTPKDGARMNPPDGFHFPNVNENMTEEEFFDWLENAMASGVFPDSNGAPGTTAEKTSAKPKQPNRKKKKSKRQW
ncbi:hypothetical protein O6H91_Y534000 [Diphasiastrum complanatum]|nr:hypothetical protein O6H91_Y534000 [Diphasiastrum complanatum]